MKVVLAWIGVVVVLGVMGLMCQRVASRGRYMASYSSLGAGPEGTRAAFELARELGYRPTRWMQDFEGLPKRAMLVALGDCESDLRRPLTRYEREELEGWVKAGGVLVVAGLGEYLPATVFDVDLGSSCQDASPPGGAVEESLPSVASSDPMWMGLEALVFEKRCGVDGPPDAAPFLLFPDGPLAIARAVGEGQVILLASASPLRNESIEGAGAAFWARLLTVYAPSRTVLFDEYHLGVGAERSIAGYLRSLGAVPLVLQALLALAFLLWRRGARFGPPRVEAVAPPGGTASYLSATGSLFAKSGDEIGAASLLARHALVKVARHFHAPSAVPEHLATFLGDRLSGAPRDAVAGLAVYLKGSSAAPLLKMTREIDALVEHALAHRET